MLFTDCVPHGYGFFEFKGMDGTLKATQHLICSPATSETKKCLVWRREGTDTQTDMLQREPCSATCVQRFDDSLNSAIHITYRSLLRSSSMHEPRDPPLKVVHHILDWLFIKKMVQ